MKQNQAIEYLLRYGKMNEDLINDLKRMLQTQEINIKKGKTLHFSGTACDRLYFVNKGILACFGPPGKNKRDTCSWIYNETHIVTCVQSFATGEPSLEKIKAVTDCELVFITKEQLEFLSDKYEDFKAIRIRLNEKYHQHSRLIQEWRLQQPEDFYAFLQKDEAHKYIVGLTKVLQAAFIGIDDATYYRRITKGLKK